MMRLIVLAIAVAFSVSCKAEDNSPEDTTAATGGKSDEIAACDRDDPLLTCLTDNCAGLTGDPFDECFEANDCVTAAEQTPDECSSCVVGTFSLGLDPAGIASACAGSTTEPQEFNGCDPNDPVITCIATNCPALSGDDFDVCFEDNCLDSASNTDEYCAFCLGTGLDNGQDTETIISSCAGTIDNDAAPRAACPSADLALFTCMDGACPDAASPDDAATCISDSCSSEAQGTTVPCLVCVDTALSAGNANVRDACTAENSAPCQELPALGLENCANYDCEFLEGPELDECMEQACPEAFDDVSEACGSCIIGLTNGGVGFADSVKLCGRL